MSKMLMLKKTMRSNYLLQMQVESFWQGLHKTSKKPYFHCGLSLIFRPVNCTCQGCISYHIPLKGF